MAVQAPNTRLPQRPYGLEDRIRQLMDQRQPVEIRRPDIGNPNGTFKQASAVMLRPSFSFVPGRDNLDDPTQQIVRTAPPDEAPTADEILQEDSPRTLGGVVGDFQPSAPTPVQMPATAAERIVELRNRARQQADAVRARSKTGPAMTVDGEVEPDLQLPDPKLEGNFTPKPAVPNRTPKAGATQTGGYYVAPGRADAAGRAAGKVTREEREKKEKADAEKAKNEEALRKEDEALDSWAAGPDGKPGTDDDNMLFRPDPDTGVLVNTGRDHPNRLDDPDGPDGPMPSRRKDRPQGLGTVAWNPAAPGTGYRGRQPGQERRIGANDSERQVPMTGRRLPDEAGNRPPMMPGRGQSVVRDGGMSPSAPQSGIVDNIPPQLLTSQPPRDQGQFFQWREAMKQLAMAAGVNIAAFENEEDLVRAGASIAKQYERMNAPVTNRAPKTVTTAGDDGEMGTPDDQTSVVFDPNGNVVMTRTPAQQVGADGKPVAAPKYERTVNSEGRPVYTPSDAMRENADSARRRAAARQFVREHKPDEDTGKLILDAADAGDFDTVDSLIRGARRDRTASTSQAAMDQSRLRGQTQQMNNPRINQAMFHEAIMQQPNAAGVNQVRAAWGIPEGSRQMVAAEAVAAEERRRDLDREVEREVGIAQAEARDKNQDGLRNYQKQVNGILTSSPDPITAINQLRTVNAAAAEAGIIPKQDVEYQTHAEVSRNEIRAGRGPNNFATQNALKMLFDKVYTVGTAAGEAVGAVGDRRQEFVRRAQLDLGCDEATADAYLASRGQ